MGEGVTVMGVPLPELLARTRRVLDDRLVKELGPTMDPDELAQRRRSMEVVSQAAIESLATALCEAMADRSSGGDEGTEYA